MRFTDRTVWVTGASSGIGECLARHFAAEGARVALSARRREKLERVAEGIVGDHSLVVPLDMTRPEDFSAAHDAVRAGLGEVDVLVHNAGISQRAAMLDTHPDDERRILETNFFGPVALTRAVLPGMVQRGRGQIVVISSVAGKFGAPLRTAYSASKHALHGWFDSLRAEVAHLGIEILLVCPGFVRTAIASNAVGSDGAVDAEIAKGMDPDACALAVVRAAAAGRCELRLGGIERFGIAVSALMPETWAGMMAKRGRRQLEGENG